MAVIAVTPGEPAGIGPDITLQLATRNLDAVPLVIADIDMLRERAAILNSHVKLFDITQNSFPTQHTPHTLFVKHLPLAEPIKAGKAKITNATYLLQTLDTAIEFCLNKKCSALVTGPINKSVINDAGIAFTGHTEYLAEKMQSTAVMMLATDKMRVALATTHLPLAKVSAAINQTNLMQTLTILHSDLKNKFGIEQPHILVTGLNPHAGEGGYLGTEEIDTIIPALEHCRAKGMHLTGPLPADTLFTAKYLDSADAVLAMYHDQGLPVLKFSGFGNAVNITLGLPVIRTSVDHGTAYDLAGTGNADASSLITAFNLAVSLSRKNR